MRLQLSNVIHALALTMRPEAESLLKRFRKDTLIAESNSGTLIDAEFYAYVAKRKGPEYLDSLLRPQMCGSNVMAHPLSDPAKPKP